jgi:alpha-beta hydrolase superfamily lysophospholipase
MRLHREGALTGVGGVRIYWQAWLPDTAPRALVVIAHGVGEDSSRYARTAARLVDDGYGVYALDHRGHGRSGGPRALIDRMDNAVADLDTLIVRARDEYPGLKVFLLGHSMGGTLSLRYAMRHQDRLAGLILSGPFASLEGAPPPVRALGRALSLLAPRLPLIRVDPSLVSRDPEVVKAYVEDPLVYHGKLPARTLGELAAAVDSFPNGVRAITLPTMILYGTADALCPPSGSAMLYDRIGSSDKMLKGYDGLFHEILNEPEQGQVLDDISKWLDARVVSDQPSVTDQPSASDQPPASDQPRAAVPTTQKLPSSPTATPP